MEDENRPLSVNNAPVPAKLPTTSRAAVAQRLNNVPEKPARGAYYSVPHKKTQPTGWRTRRYIKRKHLHRYVEQYTAVDRMGTQYTMLPMALIALLIMVLVAGLLFGATAALQATQQRYLQQVTTLQDILPKDSLKMYDAHGTMIDQMVNQGLQTTVPLSQISQNLVNAEVATEDQNFWSDPGVDITGIVRQVSISPASYVQP